jgi:hypothetical protein
MVRQTEFLVYSWWSGLDRPMMVGTVPRLTVTNSATSLDQRFDIVLQRISADGNPEGNLEARLEPPQSRRHLLHVRT